MYTVYMHKFPNGKVYVGITKNSIYTRWASGQGYKHNKRMTNAINKYGWENISHIIIAKNISKEEACKLEIEKI
jgi:predicted GIY-YIG superfamily endonuclease